MRVILLGPPGAGKGTQASRLAESMNAAHVASGDLFRKHLGEGTELGKLAKTYMDRGELVPDDVTIKMVLERIGAPDAVEGYVLDGFPRTIEQAKALDAALYGQGEKIDLTPLIEVGTEELVQRLAGRWICRGCQRPFHELLAPSSQHPMCDACGGELYQRDDDKPEVVRLRLETYDRQTAPLVAYYDDQGKLKRVQGEQGISEVHDELWAMIQ